MSRGAAAPSARVVRLVVALAIALDVALVPAFYLFQEQGIESRVDQALDLALQSGGEGEAEGLPEAYLIYADEVGAQVLGPAEERLGAYALARRDQVFPGVRQSFGEGDGLVWWRMAEESSARTAQGEVLLAYCNVGFALGVLRRTAVVLAAVTLASATALALAGRAAAHAIVRRDEALRAFFANASHELKTPLMTIQGNVAGLRGGYVPADDALDAMDAACERMSDMVGAILDLSRVDSGMAQPELSPCDVREVMYDALGAVEAEALRRGVVLDMRAPEPLPRQLDERMAYAIVSNGVANGVRHAASRLSVTAERGEGGAAVIRMANDGVPVSAADCAHAFDRFYCGEGGQTGIGLALAAEYARLMGGSIQMRQLEEGTELVIVL